MLLKYLKYYLMQLKTRCDIFSVSYYL